MADQKVGWAKQISALRGGEAERREKDSGEGSISEGRR
jgi:hypothetical protein